ncbi:hypothetical protein OG400_18840 [Micromonospora ureilytica]|uniref:hypothetical protein n=1 Tax=Micromonospora ureilytica TaxID=709868 RepID=UPI002E0D32F2|nr:hypothetical protein OG400_18840 [Micromonospora ureilytica]
MTRNDPTVEFLTRASRFCREQADDLQGLLGPILASTASASAPATRDHKELLSSVRSADRQELWSRAAFACLHMAVHVADHVRALGVLLAQSQVGVPVYAHASLARSAVEAAALLMHVLAEGQPFEVRFSRGVALLIADAGMAAKSAARVPGNAYMASPDAAVAKEKEQLLTLIKRASIELASNGSGARVKGVRVTAGGPETPVEVKTTDLVQRAFADLPEIYGMLSGVVHGLPWRLGDSAQVHGRQAVWQAQPMEVGGSVLAAVTAAGRAGGSFAWYRGFGDEPAVAGMRARAKACDEALRLYGERRGVLAGMRPSIARFLTPQ